MIDAIAAGHLCVDIIPQITDEATAASGNFLAPGRLTEVGGAVLTTGGAVSNTGIALHRLGLNVRLVARIGHDFIANLTRDILNARDPKLTEGLTVAHGEPSSYTVVISPPGIDRTFLHCPGTNNTFGPEDISPDLLSQARIFHFGYPPLMRRMYADDGIALSTIFREAKAQGVTTSLDMAMPDPTRPAGKADWHTILMRSLPYVDLFLPSVEELLYMLRRERYDELSHTVGQAHMIDSLEPEEISSLAQETLALGTKILGIKFGHRGFYLRTAEHLTDLGRGLSSSAHGALASLPVSEIEQRWSARELWAPCFKVDVVNTVGSGDSTIAGFLAAILNGLGPVEAATFAVAVGKLKRACLPAGTD